MTRRRIRVANVVEEGRFGGPHGRIAAVAERLKARGIETTVLCPVEDSETFRQVLDGHGVATILLRMHRLTRHLPHLARYLACLPFEIAALAAVIRRHRFDIVHCNGSWQWKGVVAAKLVGAPVVWHQNDTHMPGYVRLVFRLLARFLADGFIVAGEAVRRVYLASPALAAKPCFEIQAPVDCARFDPDRVAPEPKIAGLDGLKLVAVGNVNPAKGFDTLIEAAGLLRRRTERRVTVVIVGGQFASQARYRARLENRIQDLGLSDVIFHGPSDDVPACLKAADVYVCSSRHEASPMSVWEALAMGLPVVATDVGDVARFNATARFGLISPPGDAEALAANLARMVEDAALRADLAGRARGFAEATFELAVCAERHARAYRALLGDVDSPD